LAGVLPASPIDTFFFFPPTDKPRAILEGGKQKLHKLQFAFTWWTTNCQFLILFASFFLFFFFEI
jgi:hypothetical protein